MRHEPADIVSLLRGKKHAVITAHERPDGDALGAALGLRRILEAAGLRARVVGLGPIPPRYQFLLQEGESETAAPGWTQGADVFFALDCGAFDRLADFAHEAVGRLPVVNIDHHDSNTLFGDANWVEPHASSAGELVYRLARTAGWTVSTAAAEALWVAIITDTGQFAYSNTSPDTLRIGAELLERLITPGCRIGVAWSATVSAILPYVRKTSVKPGRINELAGTYLTTGIPYVVSWPLGEKLGVSVESIPMPVLVRNGRVKEMMIQEPAISSALESAAKVDLAFVGLGNISRNSSIMRTGYIGEEHLEEFASKGAVGDILMRYYDASGRYIPMSFEDKTVSLEWEKITKLPFVVAMAFGPDKLEAIAGALAGGIIHGLVTDCRTAEILLEGK